MNSKHISRRDFLQVAGLGGAALLLGSRLDAFGRHPSLFSTGRAQMEPFVPDAELSITADEKMVQILSGAPTTVCSYKGSSSVALA